MPPKRANGAGPGPARITHRITRRRMISIVAAAGAGAWLGSFGLPHRPPPQARRVRRLMGTDVHLTVVGDDEEHAVAAAESALDRMARLESLLSRHRAESELGRLNRDGSVSQPSRALRDVLGLADRIHSLGDGAFDVTMLPLLDLHRETLARHRALPTPSAIEATVARVDQRALTVDDDEVRLARPGMAVSLDGIAKGWIVDAGVAELVGFGFERVLLEAGGDLVARGRRGDGLPWSIGIRRPRPGLSELLARFDAVDIAVATSGDTFQSFTPDFARHHILDPRSGTSSPELASATVIAPTAAEADALATLAMVAGSGRTREILETLPGCEACFVTKESVLLRTDGFPCG